MQKKPLSVILIGLGYLGKIHLQKLLFFSKQKKISVVAIVEPNQEAWKEVKKMTEGHFSIPCYASLEEAFKEKEKTVKGFDIEAAVIVSPTSQHFKDLEFLQKYFIPIFCEKPLCATLEQTQKILNSWPENIPLFLGHLERYREIWQSLDLALVESLKSGGGLLKIERSGPVSHRANDVSVVVDLCFHDLDLLCFLLTPYSLVLESVRFQKCYSAHPDFCEIKFSCPEISLEIEIVSHRLNREGEKKRQWFFCGPEKVFFLDLVENSYKQTYPIQKYCQFSPQEDLILKEQELFFKAIEEKALSPFNTLVSIKKTADLIFEILKKG